MCMCIRIYILTYIYIYIYIYMVTPPRSTLAGFIPSHAYLHIRIHSLVISTETTVNIGVFRCCPRTHTTLLLSILFQYIDKSAAEFRPTNLTLYVLGKAKLWEGTRVHLLWYSETSCFFAFFGRERTVTVHQSRELCISFGD